MNPKKILSILHSQLNYNIQPVTPFKSIGVLSLVDVTKR